MTDDAPPIRPLAPAELDAALPLIAGYQRFYRMEEPDDARNAEFFARFLDPSDDGLLLGGWRDGRLVGFGCVYWTFSSVRAIRVGLLNDLYVANWARGQGVGEALVEGARAACAQREIPVLRWWTEIDNRRAQRLYERTGASRSAWFEYELTTRL